MKKLNTFMLLAFLLTSKLLAQEVNTAKLDSLFDVLNANNKTMGSFAIAKNGEVLYEKSIGYSLIEGDKKVEATAQTQYRIGSITKPFTAILIYQLIEKGKLSLDTRLDRYFPEVPNANQITIANLLGHTSGLADYVSDTKDFAWITSPRTREELMGRIIKGETHFAPGTDTRYCNSGYLLLSYIIESINKKPYAQVLEQGVLKKIGLKNTISSVVNNAGENESKAYGFQSSWSDIKDIYFPNVIGVGDILSTSNDLLSFIKALNEGKLVSPKYLRLMKDNGVNNDFGKGLMRIPFYSIVGYGHAGDTYGVHCVVESFEKEGFDIAICVNGRNYPTNDVNIAMLSILYNMPYTSPSFKKIVLSPEQLNVYKGVYSSKEIPIKLSVGNNGLALVVTPTGQPAITFDTLEENKFKFDLADIVLEFNKENAEIVMRQKGMTFHFTRDN